MPGGNKLDEIAVTLRDRHDRHRLTVHVDVFDNSLSRKWLAALDSLLINDLHLEKNYCFLGFADSKRNGWYILSQVNRAINHINRADLGYTIHDYFDMHNTMTDDAVDNRVSGRNIRQERLNQLHRYFEDLQGTSNNISSYFRQADAETRWHIRQLNLLCHEFESWALSYRKQIEAPDWQRPSQLMCWLQAPRFVLDAEDLTQFGIDRITRPLGAVCVGVNKSVAKHHWEVFRDEGDAEELKTTVMSSQTVASGDFDIEWGRDPSPHDWQQKQLGQFREWLLRSGFDPDDPTLTIGHPRVGQVDLERSFGTTRPDIIWYLLLQHLDVVRVSTSTAAREYLYRWDHDGAKHTQINILGGVQ